MSGTHTDTKRTLSLFVQYTNLWKTSSSDPHMATHCGISIDVEIVLLNVSVCKGKFQPHCMQSSQKIEQQLIPNIGYARQTPVYAVSITSRICQLLGGQGLPKLPID